MRATMLGLDSLATTSSACGWQRLPTAGVAMTLSTARPAADTLSRICHNILIGGDQRQNRARAGRKLYCRGKVPTQPTQTPSTICHRRLQRPTTRTTRLSMPSWMSGRSRIDYKVTQQRPVANIRTCTSANGASRVRLYDQSCDGRREDDTFLDGGLDQVLDLRKTTRSTTGPRTRSKLIVSDGHARSRREISPSRAFISAICRASSEPEILGLADQSYGPD